jgi:hypothetical protein
LKKPSFSRTDFSTKPGPQLRLLLLPNFGVNNFQICLPHLMAAFHWGVILLLSVMLFFAECFVCCTPENEFFSFLSSAYRSPSVTTRNREVVVCLSHTVKALMHTATASPCVFPNYTRRSAMEVGPLLTKVLGD